MLRPIFATIASVSLTLILLAISAPFAEAKGERVSSQSAAGAVPLKDCTRFNARFGYYGNPWCTPAEQARWDRWDAARKAGR